MKSMLKKVGRVLSFRKKKGTYVVDDPDLGVSQFSTENNECDNNKKLPEITTDSGLRRTKSCGNVRMTESPFVVTESVLSSAQSIHDSEVNGLHMKEVGSSPFYEKHADDGRTSARYVPEFLGELQQKKKDVFELQPSVPKPTAPVPAPRFTVQKVVNASSLSLERQPPLPAPRLSLLRKSKNNSPDLLQHNCMSKMTHESLHRVESDMDTASLLYSPSVMEEVNLHFDVVSPTLDTDDLQPTYGEAELIDEDIAKRGVRL